MVVPSAQYKQYENDCRYFVPKGLNIDYPVNVKCLFFMKTRRKVDLTNLLESVDDVLVYYGIVTDDNYKVIAGHDGSRVMVDKDNPRTEIYITALEDDDPEGDNDED